VATPPVTSEGKADFISARIGAVVALAGDLCVPRERSDLLERALAGGKATKKERRDWANEWGFCALCTSKAELWERMAKGALLGDVGRVRAAANALTDKLKVRAPLR